MHGLVCLSTTRQAAVSRVLNGCLLAQGRPSACNISAGARSQRLGPGNEARLSSPRLIRSLARNLLPSVNTEPLLPAAPRSKNEGVSLTPAEWALRRGHAQLAALFEKEERSARQAARLAELPRPVAAAGAGSPSARGAGPAASPQKRRRVSNPVAREAGDGSAMPE